MSAAQPPTRDHSFLTDDVSPELRDLALSMYAQPAPQRPAHRAEHPTLWTISSEAHAEMRAESACPVPAGSCWVCDRVPGRHVEAVA